MSTGAAWSTSKLLHPRPDRRGSLNAATREEPTVKKPRGQMTAEAPAAPTFGTTRRSFLKQVGTAALAATGAPLGRPRISVAAPVTLSIWTGFPEIEQFYKKAGDEYAKTHPGFKLETLSTELRGMEQKIAAA